VRLLRTALGCSFLIVVVGFFFTSGCEPRSKLPEAVPNISPATDAIELHHYVLEFAIPAHRPDSEIEPFVPFKRNMIQGRIDSVDHNTNCSLWLIRSHSGSAYFEDQKLYLYSEKSNSLKELTVYLGTRFEGAVVLCDEPGEEPLILTTIWPPNSRWYTMELWTNRVGTTASSRLTVGGSFKVSPDHSKVAFWRTDGEGFYSLHLWDVGTRAIEDVISLWELDRGSGTSWDWTWSADSKVLNVQGVCGGFHQKREGGRNQFNFLYVVKEKKMYYIDKPAHYKP
jgi:hypothetical protein